MCGLATTSPHTLTQNMTLCLHTSRPTLPLPTCPLSSLHTVLSKRGSRTDLCQRETAALLQPSQVPPSQPSPPDWDRLSRRGVVSFCFPVKWSSDVCLGSRGEYYRGGHIHPLPHLCPGCPGQHRQVQPLCPLHGQCWLGSVSCFPGVGASLWGYFSLHTWEGCAASQAVSKGTLSEMVPGAAPAQRCPTLPCEALVPTSWGSHWGAPVTHSSCQGSLDQVWVLHGCRWLLHVPCPGQQPANTTKSCGYWLLQPPCPSEVPGHPQGQPRELVDTHPDLSVALSQLGTARLHREATTNAAYEKGPGCRPEE